MTATKIALIVSLGALASGSPLAQQQASTVSQTRPATPAPAPAQGRGGTPTPTPTPTPVAATAVAPAPRRVTQPINVKVDLSITDQHAGSPPIKRTLSVIVADGYTGSIRSQSDVHQVGTIPLNVDADPELLPDGKIRLRLNVQYDWPAEIARDAPRGTVLKTSLHDSVALILESGHSAVAAQSADPIGDRQVTVEVKATILK